MLGIAILAAGKGKRMNSTDTPKVLVQLKGKPLLGYVLDTSLKLSPKKIYVIVGFKKELVIDFVNKFYPQPNITIVEQKEQLGTGHAILQLENVIDADIESLLILSGDVPLISTNTLKNFIDFHISGNYDLSLVSTRLENPYGYGRIVRKPDGYLLKIVEQKDLSPDNATINEINAGIYLVKVAGLFDYLKSLKNDNAQNEYYLTDIIEMYISSGKRVGAFLIENYVEVLGINTYQELNALEALLDTNKIGI